jgi:Protein of unknown function (DUF3631)
MNSCELNIIEDWLRRYVHYTNEHCATAHVLWCPHALLMEHWDISPRLGFFSALPGSGKTNALMLTSYLCGPHGHAGSVSVSVSPAALARKAGETVERQADLPPQFLDEIDNLYNAASKDGATDLTTAILNGGHKRGNIYERMVGKNNDQVRQFRIFGSIAMAGLGKARLPESLADRLIRIPMEPVKPCERVERFRQRILESEHKSYRDALGEFCERADCKLDLDAVTIPDALNGRDIDNWEPLLAVAEVAGGDWPSRARRAAIWFCALKAMTKRDSLGLRLLKEVVEYLREVTKAETKQIWQHLYNKSGAPWCDFRFFNESWIRETLYEFPGAPRQGDVRIGEVRVQGFHIDWFADLIERYISPGEIPDTPDSIDNKNNDVGPVGPVVGGSGADVIPLRQPDGDPHDDPRPDLTVHGPEPISHIEAFNQHVESEERAAIREYEGGQSRHEADIAAWQETVGEIPEFLRRTA